MQLLYLAVYNAAGQRREVRFVPGQLNIVTGISATGKSALLEMVEYCLGRDTIMMPVGPITATVRWYAALFLLPDGGRAFVARPAPQPGRASTQRAMLEFGAKLELLPASSLGVNIDTDALREQLGRRIGIEENQHEPPPGSLRSALEAHLGHAALLCLQRQDEIASRTLLFHRQGEPGMEQTLKDTLPYFLGATARDQAVKRARLRDAKRTLARMSTALTSARQDADTIEPQLQALLSEAYAVGLTSAATVGSRPEVISLLERAARVTPPDGRESAQDPDSDEDSRRRALARQQGRLRAQLGALSADRQLLLDTFDGENDYRGAVQAQVGRLTSLNLLPNGSAGPPGDGAEHSCPVCGSALAEPDPAPAEMQRTLDALQSQLVGIDEARPARRAALTSLDSRAAELRDQLRVADAALRALSEGDSDNDSFSGQERRAFTRGRISATLATLTRTDDHALRRLQLEHDAATRAVAALEAELDDNEERMQLDSRLAALSRDMTQWSQQLALEHGEAVRLDINRLTVVTDTAQGPAPLWRIGSAENWIGAHLVTHLALHRFFVRNGRPVPRLLMLDQPTQAYYPSEIERRTGVPERDSDREAVRRMFRLLYDIAAELSPNLQIIVCDHANLPEEWFRESVVHNWRDGEALIPEAWLTGT
jgi:Protein of unknown function (DUF3732)